MKQADLSIAEPARTGSVPAIARAAAVLRLLGRSETPLTLSAIARELGIIPSSCLYVLRALVAEELVAFDPALKRYSLESGVLTLARHWLRQNPFPGLIQPTLDRLARRFGVMTLGVQIVGLEHVVVVAASEAGGQVQLSTSVGSRFPALISATGRVLAAFGHHPALDIRRRFKTLRWADPPTFDTWLDQVGSAREHGVGIDRGNYMAGITVFAAPVWRRAGDPSHAIVALGVAGAMGAGEAALTDALVTAAAGLSIDDLIPPPFRAAAIAAG